MKASYTAVLYILVFGSFVVTTTRAEDHSSIAGCWIGTLTLEGESLGISGHIERQEGQLTGVFDVPEIGNYGMVFDTIRVDGSTVRMTGGVGRNRLSLEVKSTTAGLAGVWRTGPMSGTMTLERCALPAAPGVAREDVTFSNGSIHLAGTLVTPAGPGPFPTIVWTHGSGNVTRTDWIYSRWVNVLARHGVASLIYDKRGHGKSNGLESEATLHDLAGDLLAGVALAKERGNVDAQRIGVAGLSQGGWIAPLAASLSTDIAFVIVESASGVPADEQDLFVQSNVLRDKGIAEQDVSKIIALRSALFGYYRSGEGKSILESQLEAAADEPWYDKGNFPALPLPEPGVHTQRTFNRFDIDVVGVWQNIRVPVLAVWGEQDRIVPAEKSRDIISAALDRAGNKNASFHTFPNGTHQLTYAKFTKDPWRQRRIIPQWPTLLCEWVTTHVAE